MEEFLRDIGIVGTLNTASNGSKVLDIEGSNNYGRVFSRLDNSSELQEDEENAQLTLNTAYNIYYSDKYMITLQANFDRDEYKLTIKEI